MRLACCWVGSQACLAVAADISAVRDALEERLRALDHLRVEFAWDIYAAPRGKDPFNRANWRDGRLLKYRGEMWIVRPHFRWHYSIKAPAELGPKYGRDETAAWVDGRCITIGLGRDNTWSVAVHPAEDGTWPCVAGYTLLTLFEIETLSEDENLLELIDRGELDIESQTPQGVVLRGQHRWRTGDVTVDVQATLDPTRGWLPVEVFTRTPRGKAGKKHRWTMKVLRSSPVAGGSRGHEAIEEAIVVSDMDPDEQTDLYGASDLYGIYHFVATTMVRDDSLTKEDLVPQVPESNVVFVDYTTGMTWQKDPQGRTTWQYVRTQEEMDEAREAVRVSIQKGIEARLISARRQRVFKIVVGAGGGVTLAAAAVWFWIWRRHALRPT